MNANLYPLENRLSRSIGSVILQRFFSISFCHSCKSSGFISSNIRIEPSTFNAEIGALVNGCWTTDGKEGFGWIGRYKKRIAVSITSFKQVLFTLIEATSLLYAITRGLSVSYYITSWSFVQPIFIKAFTRIVKQPTWSFTNSLASMFYIAKRLGHSLFSECPSWLFNAFFLPCCWYGIIVFEMFDVNTIMDIPFSCSERGSRCKFSKSDLA